MKTIKVVSTDGYTCYFLEGVLNVVTEEWLHSNEVRNYWDERRLDRYLHNEFGPAFISAPGAFVPTIMEYYLDGSVVSKEEHYKIVFHDKLEDIIDEID